MLQRIFALELQGFEKAKLTIPVAALWHDEFIFLRYKMISTVDFVRSTS